MRDDFDLEEELAKSIASIVDEETADAHAYVNKNTSETDDIPDEEEKIYDEPDDDSDDDSDKPDKKKIIIIVASVVAAVLIIGITAFLVVRAAFNKSKDNYGYYNELGYKAYDDKDYDTAISDFEKALTYDEGKGDSDTNINMMLYLFECYKNTSQDDKAEEILLDVLDRDSDNKNAYYNLMSVYLNGKDYPSDRQPFWMSRPPEHAQNQCCLHGVPYNNWFPYSYNHCRSRHAPWLPDNVSVHPRPYQKARTEHIFP